MSVEEWARERTEKRYPDGWSDDDTRVRLAREGVQYGIVHAFDALLSDEAVEAAARGHVEYRAGRAYNEAEHLATRSEVEVKAMRAALQAAVDAVTKGDKP